MASRDDLESYISRLSDEVSAEEVEEGIWVLSPSEDGANMVVSFDPPVVVFRVNVMNLPDAGDRRAELMQRLLELNAQGLVHGSYGIEGKHIVLTDALQLENLDFNEFQATVDEISLALAQHMTELASYQE